MPEDAVVDAAIDAAAPPVETTASPAIEPQADAADTGDTPDTPEPGKPLQLLQDRNGSRVLHPQLKQQLEEWKKSGTPEQQQMARALTKTLFDQDKAIRQFGGPQGFQEVAKTVQEIEQLGGIDGIRELHEGNQYYSTLQKQFEEGDPEFIKELTFSPKEQAAFSQHAPNMVAKWAELQPEAHAAYVSQAVLDFMGRSGFQLALDRLADFLPADNPKAVEVYQRLNAVLGQLTTMAGKPLAPVKQAAAPQDDARMQELTARETRLKEQEWKGRSDQNLLKIQQGEWQRQLGNRQIDGDTRQALMNLWDTKLQELLPPDFDAKMQKLFDSGQQDAFLKLHQSTMEKISGEALRWAIRAMKLGATPGPKPGTAKPPQNGRAASPQSAQPVAAGVKMLPKKPDMQTQVDQKRTTPGMWMQRQAYLKDGTKVTWRP